jgi:hypothetical protein
MDFLSNGWLWKTKSAQNHQDPTGARRVLLGGKRGLCSRDLRRGARIPNRGKFKEQTDAFAGAYLELVLPTSKAQMLMVVQGAAAQSIPEAFRSDEGKCQNHESPRIRRTHSRRVIEVYQLAKGSCS